MMPYGQDDNIVRSGYLGGPFGAPSFSPVCLFCAPYRETHLPSLFLTLSILAFFAVDFFLRK
jgi:hypothetical protein